jgi:cytochrome c oxidase subunit 2
VELFPPDISPVAGVIDDLFWRAVWLTGGAGIVVVGVLLYFVLRYRSKISSRAYYTQGTSRGALTLTFLLAASVFFGIDVSLAYYDHRAFQTMYGHPPAEGEALVVQVFAKQFEWNFRYPGNDGRFGTPDDVMLVNKLVVPEGQKVLLLMRSLDVVHSLFLPHLRTKQDVVPGLTVALWFEANRTTRELRDAQGDPKFDLEIACAELCGQNHTNMRGRLQVLEREEFDGWYREESEAAFDYEPAEIWRHWVVEPLSAT